MLKFIRQFVLWILIASLVGLGTVRQAEASPILVGALFSFSGTRPDHLGIRDRQFAACPQTPNCVNSFSRDPTHAIEPFRYTTSPEKAFADLKSTIQSLPRTNIIEASTDYLYAEFTSKIMGFVDDVEFYLDKTANVIQVRSASRLGESDLGVNRARIESIRAQLKQVGDLA